MTPEKIATILAQHAEWLRDTSKGARTDLRDADLSSADLSSANLSGADLRGANLSGADLDYAAWPLWCGSLQVALDERLQAQLLYHVLAVAPSLRALAPQEMLDLANGSHVVRSHGQPKLTASQPEARP